MPNIEAGFAQPAALGADGVVLWGACPAPADDKQETLAATVRFLNQTYPALLARHCQRVGAQD